MKDFFKYVLATVVGIILVSLICTIISVITLLGMASKSTKSVPNDAVLVLKLDGSISERSQDNPFESLLGSATTQMGLDDILKAIRNAQNDDKVKGIYIEAGNFAGATPAQLQEIRQALLNFKKSGKFIVSYGDQYTQGTYYLASVADSVVINPEGMLDWKGLSFQTLYYKDVLDKVGVKMEIFKVGTYKSAVEPYFLTEMSDANREQITVFSDEIWKQMQSEVAKSRKFSYEQLNQLTDEGLTFKETNYYLKKKLVDKVAFSDEVPQMLAYCMDRTKAGDYNTISVEDLAASTSSEPKGTSGNVIAVYYAAGEIVQSDESSLGSMGEMIAADKVTKDLKDLANDNDVKAVVMRVNSPGGSAFASEQIWHQVMNIKSKKPIIVSMGGYAASGGYYISCAADYIVAEPTTLTGSIGIFGVFPVAEELINKKIGIHANTVKTNQFADFGDYTRQMTEAEKNALQTYINRGYELFTKRCADGRKMPQDSIKAIAEGRVWTGEHALKIGLVDKLGNLDDAIEIAKQRANVTEATILSYPAKSSFFEQLMDKANNTDSYADAKMKELLGPEFYNFFINLRSLDRKGSVNARVPFYGNFNL